MPDLQAVPTAVWWLLVAGLAIVLISERALVAKVIAWLWSKLPSPTPLPPAPPPDVPPAPPPPPDPIAMYKGLKAHCADCPPDVLAAFRTIWLHLDDPHGNLVSRVQPPKGGYNQ